MVLVTGGDGYIGRQLCALFTAQGKNFICLDKDFQDTAFNKYPYPTVKCDITDSASFRKVFKSYSFSSIIHLASILKTASRNDPILATKVNIEGSVNVLEAAQRYSIPRIIYGSSISVYGTKSLNCGAVTESDPAAPEDLYGSAKRYVEIMGGIYCKRFGIEFISLRISMVIGPGAPSTFSPWRTDLFKLLGSSAKRRVSIPFERQEMIPFNHVRDVAAMLAIVTSSAGASFDVYNTPSETWLIQDLISYIKTLDADLNINYGASKVQGIPRLICGQRFINDFNYSSVALEERFKNSLEDNKKK